jgi:hypothetical protein
MDGFKKQNSDNLPFQGNDEIKVKKVRWDIFSTVCACFLKDIMFAFELLPY